MLTARADTKTTDAPPGNPTPTTARSQAARQSDVRVTPAVGEAIVRVEAEYREMPGLSLTLAQATRLWGLDRRTCELALANLLERRVLKRAVDGSYIRRR